MHGTVFAELEKFVVTNHSTDTWSALVRATFGEERGFDPLSAYPDDEAEALIIKASEMTGTPVPELVEAFGHFISVDLMKMYWGLIEPGWKTLDVILHTENHIHKVVRLDHPNAQPPALKVERTGEKEVVMTYDSPRHLCNLAKGVARGLAEHFEETLEIEESACMADGAERCVIAFRTT